MSKKGAGAAVSGNVASVPLDDATWKTFIFTVVPDADSPTGQADYATLVKDAVAPLADAVNSGVRQKFVSISKSDLVQWASENAKQQDVCKDLKAAADSAAGSLDQVPDQLFAKVLKIRLLVLKQEGVEALAASRAAREAELANAQKAAAGDKKAPAPDAKKDGVAKAPGKRDDRPESGAPSQDADSMSKRKNKLRDRVGGKTETRINMLNDEPLDGPDAYYMLKDFTSLSFFTYLSEELDVNISMVLRIEGAIIPPEVTMRLAMEKAARGDTEANGVEPESNLSNAQCRSSWRTSSNRTLVAFRNAFFNASDTSIWRRVCFVDLNAQIANSGKDLFDHVAQAVYSVLDQRKKHESYYEGLKQITIPSVNIDPHSRKRDYKYYDYLSDAPLQTSACAPELSLLFAVEQVCRTSDMDGDMADDDDMNNSLGLNLLNNIIDSSLARVVGSDVARAAENASNDKLASEYMKSFSHFDGVSVMRHFYSKVKTPAAVDINEFASRLPSLYPALSFVRALDELSNTPEQQQRRLLVRSQLRRSSSLPLDVLNRSLLLLEFGEILGLSRESDALRDFCWEEQLDSNAIVQAIESAKMVYPELKYRFSQYHGKLLLAFSGAGQVAEKDGTHSRAVNAKNKLGFGLFHYLNNYHKDYLTSQNEPYVYISDDQIVYRVDEADCTYLSNRMALSNESSKSIDGSQTERVAVRHADYTLSVPKAPEDAQQVPLTLSFTDQYVASIDAARDSQEIYISTPTGLAIQIRNDGSVVQRLTSSQSVHETIDESGSEFARVYMPDGTVVRHMSSGKSQILFPTGSSAILQEDGSKTITSRDGKRTYVSSSNEITELQGLEIDIAGDAKSSRTVIQRSDMVEIITREDTGEITVEWADHTKSFFNMKAKSFRIESPGFATVERVDGEQLSIHGIGGLNFEQKDRAHFTLSRGQVSLNFETGGIALLNSCVHIDVFKGVVQVNRQSAHAMEHTHSVSQSISQESSLQDVGVSKAQNVANQLVEHAKEIAAVPNAPMLMCLNRDGTGSILHTDADLVSYFQSLKNRRDTEIIEEEISGESAVLVTIARKLAEPAGEFGPAFITRSLVRHVPLSQTVHDQALMELKKFENWRRTVDRKSDEYLVYMDAAQPENLSVSSSSSPNSAIVLGRNKNETMKAILEKFKLRQEDIVAGANQRNSSSEGGNRDYMIPHILYQEKPKSSTTKTDSYQQRPPSRLVQRMHMEFNEPVPRYFDSVEGLMFLQSQDRTELENTTVPTQGQKGEDEPLNLGAEQVRERSQHSGTSMAARSTQNPVSKVSSSPAKRQVPSLAPARPKVDVDEIKDVRPYVMSLKNATLDTIPNTKFLKTEVETKRKLNTASMAPVKDALPSLAVFDVWPSHCRFGTLREGSQYQIQVTLLNIGNDSSRFRLKAPTTHRENIDITYSKGPVAPGMRSTVNVIVKTAPSMEQESLTIEDKLQVITETEIITIPITATFIKSNLFDTLAPPMKKHVQRLDASKIGEEEGSESRVPVKTTVKKHAKTVDAVQ